jgi:hypothetical protein
MHAGFPGGTGMHGKELDIRHLMPVNVINMTEDYIVEQGDCISSVAYERGFFWETLWNHLDNGDLKQQRKDPNLLMEGDAVHIPDLNLKTVSGATEKKHTFKLKGVPAKLRLQVFDGEELWKNQNAAEMAERLERSSGGNSRIGRNVLGGPSIRRTPREDRVNRYRSRDCPGLKKEAVA